MSSQHVASGLGKLVGRSAAMAAVRAAVTDIAAAPIPVMILGETGTGKEVCAQIIAELSGARPFVVVNCAAVPESLVDAELFGYERGAFTGAVRTHAGIVAQANGGLLFLDELAEMAPTAQAKLLRTLETGEYRPVGSTRMLRSSFRIVAATNGNVGALVEAGRLRSDLIHRLGAMRIVLPPLRERLEDVPLLVEHFLARYREKAGAGPESASAEALGVLCGQEWPGNVRQLRNVIEAAAALARGGPRIEADHVLRVIGPLAVSASPREETRTLAEAVRRAEQFAIEDALRRANHNRERAAELLGISEATLYRKLARYGMLHPSGTLPERGSPAP